MAESEAKSSFGAQLTRLTTPGPPKIYTNLVELLGVTPPTKSRASQQTTHHASPDQAHEYIPTIFEGGEVPFTYNWTKTGRAALDTAMAAGKTEYKVLYPDGSSELVLGFITELATETFEVDGVMAGSGTIKVSGLPVFTPAA